MRRRVHIAVGFGIVILIIVLFVGSLREWYNPASKDEPALYIWLGMLALMLGFLLNLGSGMKGTIGGVLVDERNRMSLSRLQMALWSVLVLSAYLTAFLVNIADERTNPLDVAIPKELWLAMGISITSLVGSSLLLTRDGTTVEPTSPPPGAPPPRAGKPGWGDLFVGDFVKNVQFIDLSKVQMFFFTLVLVLGYAAAVGDTFVDIGTMDVSGKSEKGVEKLPKLDEAFVILLGLADAGYLTRKAVGPEGVRAGRRRD